MNYNTIHKQLDKFNEIVNNKFKEQLLSIHSKARLCYQSQYDKFTVSLYNSERPELDVQSIIETEHLIIRSDFPYTLESEQLAYDLTKFIMKE